MTYLFIQLYCLVKVKAYSKRAPDLANGQDTFSASVNEIPCDFSRDFESFARAQNIEFLCHANDA